MNALPFASVDTVATETHRIQQHLAGAETLARSRRHAHTRRTPAQHLVRELLLDELAHYREAGRFPENPDFDAPMPYFIDARGTRCAMAHLMEIGGAAPLVAEIAATRNNAFVAELAGDPRVAAWLDAAGLTVDEAARIQPTYCPSAPSTCVCKRASVDNQLFVRASRTGEQGKLVITELSGTGSGACAKLKIGDGIDLQSYPEGLTEYVAVAVSRPAPNGAVPSCFGEEVFKLRNGAPACHNGLADVALPSALSLAETASLLSAADCADRLAARGSAWTDKPDCDNGIGCSSAPAGAGADGSMGTPLTVLVLGAVLAYRAARLRATRRS